MPTLRFALGGPVASWSGNERPSPSVATQVSAQVSQVGSNVLAAGAAPAHAVRPAAAANDAVKHNGLRETLRTFATRERNRFIGGSDMGSMHHAIGNGGSACSQTYASWNCNPCIPHHESLAPQSLVVLAQPAFLGYES